MARSNKVTSFVIIFNTAAITVILHPYDLIHSKAFFSSYIVYLGGHSHGPDPSPSDLVTATNSHYDLLASVLGSYEKAEEAIVYSYNKHINGFAAMLEEEEASEIAKKRNAVSVFLSEEHKLHTTRSWEFLGLEKDGIIPPDSAWKKARFGENTIIANIDSGILPIIKSAAGRLIGD
ncbi:subtilisin-like protease Glyma18g48580 [Abrus precatorius]|uniref:Subtilisin-like protease Glyma18g48580 n=1 Tax=Abrus precatorius TaxID=3816 RepID=A0A8B8MKV5_ABRPR|nr:subtilisin-like protease Glyma18g48580 [Abrus precatorius]